MTELQRKLETPYRDRPYGVHVRPRPKDKNLSQAVLSKAGSREGASRDISPEAVRRRGLKKAVALGAIAAVGMVGAIDITAKLANHAVGAQHQTASANERAQHAYQDQLEQQAAQPDIDATQK
ncbi:MAG: hypothetical protein WA843_00235 [Candidatus Saccharimonadales bacterium]